MFEFLFKRPGDKPGETPASVAMAAAAAAAAAGPANPERALQAEKVAGLGDEAAAAAFILQCDFSELRLAAAEMIVSPAYLEQVHAAMRNTDRRVAKLMQSRLDTIRHYQAELARGQACIAQAEALLADAILTPNHVGELDRRWSVIAAPELAGQFDAVRAALAARLEAQVLLQRAMIDRVAALRLLADADLPAEEALARLAQMGLEHEQALAAPEHASLPRQLLHDFLAEQARVADLLAARAAAPVAAPAPVADATVAQPVRPPKAPRVQAQPPSQAFLDALTAMEAALEQGALAAAADSDKQLKDAKGVRLAPAVADRLAHARAELKRLSDWARWGGNVSREELVKAVEHLATEKLPMAELAKKVGSMRERWKGLDSHAGPAPKSLWERFDAACSAAYAPAAAHFKHLAEERHANAAKAQAMVAEVAAEAARLADGSADWKHVALAVQRMRLAWSHLGAIDRKDKKRLDHEFNAALAALQAPLNEQRKGETAVREELIAKATALNPLERHTLDTLKSLQEQWQVHARALPLERKAEQALWQRFRAACDAVFAKRKESAHAADAERRAHQHAKEALCARLEAAAGGADAAGAGKLLREVAAEWQGIGPVPRAHEEKIDKRYHAAQAGLHQVVEAARRSAGLAQASALRERLRLVHAFEAAIANGGAGDGWAERWAALPAGGALDKVLQARFDAALKAEPAAHARLLEQNRDTLLREVLRLEIVAGIDSGSEFARDRLKLQVEVLQSSLKSGHKPSGQGGGLAQLLALPALADDRTISRIEHLFARSAREGK